MKVCPLCKTEYPGGEVFCPLDGARLVTPSAMDITLPGGDPLVGMVLGERYKILKRIGEGGMGIVYEAMHIVIEKHVALKVLRDDFSARPEVVERFRQEAKSASRIGHENIVDISDFGETATKQSYFVMEMLEGEDLADVLAREGTLNPARAVKILIQCCKALGAAHAKGIVHRDMKPENIFLVTREDSKDFVKIVDFGIAKMSDIETQGQPGRKLTKTGMIFGTPEYMSPEQAAGKPLDHRVDIYALGVILFEMLTGRVPFQGDTFMGVLTQHMFEPIPSLVSMNPHVKVPPELEQVVMKALAKDPDIRFQTMDELGRFLASAMDFSQPFPLTEQTTPGFGEPVRSKLRTARTMDPETTDMGMPATKSRAPLVALVGVVLVLGLAGGGYAAWRATQGGAGPGGGASEDAGTVTPFVVDAIDLGTQVATGDAVPPTGPVDAGAALVDAGTPAAAAVRLAVTTHPAGASVTVDGRGSVCDTTPCSFETARGIAIVLHAHKGRATATRELTPNEATDLDLVLVSHGGGGHPPGGGDDTGGGELKIPDIFRHPH